MRENESPWPKRGLSGKVSAAQTHAPESATDREILTVGWRAWDEERDVADVWREVVDA